MSRISLLTSTLLLLSSACALVTGLDEGRLSVRAGDDALLLANEGRQPVYYFAIESDAAARTFWGPCDDPERCPRVRPGEWKQLPLAAVSGWTPGAQRVIVYWWRLVPKEGGGFRPDSIRAVGVRP